MARMFTAATNGTAKAIACDEHFGVLGVVDFEHIATDSGAYYSASRYVEGVSSDGTIDILIITPSSVIESALLGGDVQAGGDAKLEVYAQPTVSSNGTALSILQVNQTSSNTPNVSAYHTPTVSNTGTLVFETFVPGGKGGVSVGSGGPFQRLNAAPDKKFLLRLINKAASAETMCVNMNWIETLA